MGKSKYFATFLETRTRIAPGRIHIKMQLCIFGIDEETIADNKGCRNEIFTHT
jgi:hypothetical protein